MQTADEYFYKEFISVMRNRASATQLNIYSLKLPRSFLEKASISKSKLVNIQGIDDDYFGKLNNTNAILWSKPTLKKRRFLHDGTFLRDKEGQFIFFKEKPLPQHCVAVISEKAIGVPTKYKSDCEYIDYIEQEGKGRRFIYVLPRKYCHLVNQTALVIAPRPLRSYYWGMSVYFMTGHLVYLYVIPLKSFNKDVEKPYRIIKTGTDVHYDKEIGEILNSWKGFYIFDPAKCAFSEPIKDSLNCSYKVFNPTLSSFDYQPFKEETLESSSDVDDLEESGKGTGSDDTL